MIPVFNTYVHPSASKQVAEVLNSTFLSEGKLVQEFENALEREFDIFPPVTLNSGTAALHLALILAGVGEGDEVIIPSQTFVATGLAVLYLRAKVVFADIDYSTGNINSENIQSKITPRTKAIIPVHWAGYPCDMDEINLLAKENNLVVIEDAAHALGAVYRNKAVGSISDYTCFSFQAIKHLTTGDGGAICCRQKPKFNDAITLRWFGIDRAHSETSLLGERKYNISFPGYKYHLNDYSAALGLANISNFAERMNHRRSIAKFYSEQLKGLSGIKLFEYNDDRESAWWLYGIHVERREEFIRSLSSRGVSCSVVHQGIHRNSVFKSSNDDLPQQRRFDNDQIHIPIHDAITGELASGIVDAIKKGW